MTTECNADRLGFGPLGRREIVAHFNGGNITSDGGGLLLREVEARTRIIEDFARCFTDYRNPGMIEHPLEDLVAQRVLALCLGYEDLNDHDDLRRDPLLAVLVGKSDPEGKHRSRDRDKGKALAGKSTLNRLELTPENPAVERYKRIDLDPVAVDQFFLEKFFQTYADNYAEPPSEVLLDLDNSDIELHGDQEGSYYNGYYDEYCYVPLYIYCGEHLLCARLLTADGDPARATVEEIERITAEIRKAWPETKVMIRGDSGFCRDEIMVWCESNDVRYVLGLAKNPRLERVIADQLEEALEEHEKTGEPARRYRSFAYQTLKTWSRERRVIGKAEQLAKGANPRFLVVSEGFEDLGPEEIYVDEYCPRGEMENRIKEQQLYLFGDRASAGSMRANQLRVYFASVAYMLMAALRLLGLEDTEMASARSDTIRTKLFKIGARIRITARKIWVSLTSACPYAELFAVVLRNLRGPEAVHG